MQKYRSIILSLATFSACFTGSFAAAATAMPMATTAAIYQESQAQFYHSQDRQLLGAAIKESILQAQKSILIFTFSLSDSEVIAALNQKAMEGLKVTVVVDRDHMGDITSRKVSAIEVVTRASGEGHLHHKILVVDEKEVWIGSANFTKSAYATQENLMVRLFSLELAAYLCGEADVFRGYKLRSAHGPLLISQPDQDIYFCLLPHDGFPAKKIEKSINDQSKQFLLEKIKQANTSIKIAMMVWTNNDLTSAVIQAHQRGVKIQIVAPDFEGNIPKLIAAGIEVKINTKLGLMHNKLMCVDDYILVNGSANWSQSSFTRSDESFIVIDPMTTTQIEGFLAYWSYLQG